MYRVINIDCYSVLHLFRPEVISEDEQSRTNPKHRVIRSGSIMVCSRYI